MAKCFPPDFEVFEIYRQTYTQKILTFVSRDISALVQAEPTVVTQLNAFVAALNEVMETLHFTEDQKMDLHPLYTWKQY